MSNDTQLILDTLRDATRGTEYENRLFLVGGFVRDKAMGLPSAKDDIDLVLEGDALALARHLRARGAADHEPVVYPRFGTAMVVVRGRDVELVTARVESYAPDSRKPDVQPGTLQDDARRRDFSKTCTPARRRTHLEWPMPTSRRKPCGRRPTRS